MKPARTLPAWQIRGVTKPTHPVHVTRKVRNLGDGVVRVDQEITMRTSGAGLDAPGDHWVFAVITLRAGKLSYLRDGSEVEPPGKKFAMFLPPYSLIQVRLETAQVRTISFCGHAGTGPQLPNEPVLLLWRGAAPNSQEEIVQAMRVAPLLVPVGRALQPGPQAQMIKQMLDRTYRDTTSLGALSRRLGCTLASMSRCFRIAYGIPPVEYRHSMRATDALVRLVRGDRVIDVSGDIGFQDLSRFYAQFRKRACAPPGSYRPTAKNAKTPPWRD
jgi:AraC-like DNA-binding protein